MDSKLYTIKGRNYSCIEKAEKENKTSRKRYKKIKKCTNNSNSGFIIFNGRSVWEW